MGRSPKNYLDIMKPKEPSKTFRNFEIRITDKAAGNVYVITLSVSHLELAHADANKMLRTLLEKRFEMLLDTAFKTGGLPGISMLAVEDEPSQNKTPQE